MEVILEKIRHKTQISQNQEVVIVDSFQPKIVCQESELKLKKLKYSVIFGVIGPQEDFWVKKVLRKSSFFWQD